MPPRDTLPPVQTSLLPDGHELVAEAEGNANDGKSRDALKNVSMAFGEPPTGNKEPLARRALLVAARAMARTRGAFGWGGKEAKAILAGKRSLDDLSVRVRPRTGQRVNLRWILLHMIEETARHAGHADLLREAVDGTTGL